MNTQTRTTHAATTGESLETIVTCARCGEQLSYDGVDIGERSVSYDELADLQAKAEAVALEAFELDHNCARATSIIKVRVSGGVAEVFQETIPRGVVVQIIDYDIDGETDTDRDEDGEPCTVQNWTRGDEERTA